ncbi:MAG: hypothetical protein KDJ34_15425 [Candidatus Competibacteraceae bacterium]|nr:hypothetical protein [Candidatus Competibacteraceae bacterium]MCP5133667.1 hypothetical protein [Gammaproteobacteria bacterium]
MNAVIEPRRHRITVAEYHQMGEVGIFDEDARIELPEGELFDLRRWLCRSWRSR